MEDGWFDGYFEKFAFPIQEEKPAARVRVKFTASPNDPATEYARDARGLLMTMNRESSTPTPPTSPQSDRPGGSWTTTAPTLISFSLVGFRSPAGAAAVNGAAKITSGHRQRQAVIYVRRPAMAQVRSPRRACMAWRCDGTTSASNRP
jgi:hypothetical protein